MQSNLLNHHNIPRMNMKINFNGYHEFLKNETFYQLALLDWAVDTQTGC